MKIFEVIPALVTGGVTRLVVDLCNELSSRNEVTLVVLYGTKDFSSFKDELLPAVTLVELNKKPGLDLSMVTRIHGTIKKGKPDIVHFHTSALLQYALGSLLLFRHCRYLYTVHSDAFSETERSTLRKLHQFLYKHQFCHPVAISKASRKSFEKAYEIQPHLITNARAAYAEDKNSNCAAKEMEHYRTSGQTKLLVSLANLDPVKNHILMCRAVNHLVQCSYDVQLLIIGNPINPKVVEEIKKLHCSNIHLLGVKNNPRDYLAYSDALCLSSLTEGMPIALIEAFSVGVVPICTPVGGMVDMIQDGHNGFLSHDMSMDAYEDALKRFLSLPPGRLEEMKKNSLQSFRAYSMEICAQNYETLMINLLEQ